MNDPDQHTHAPVLHTADVVVAGFGLAGAVAALEAGEYCGHENVVILERMAQENAGGNSRASTQELFIPKDLTAFQIYLRAMNEPNPPAPEILNTWLEELQGLENWLDVQARKTGRRLVRLRQGTAKADFPDLPGAACVEYYCTVEPGRSALWETFRDLVQQANIPVHFNARVVRLIKDGPSGRITGVAAEIGGQTHLVTARRGVVLACGGYENDPTLLKNYNGLEQAVPGGTRGNTGDGMRMLQLAGAELWHIRNKTHAGGFYPGFCVPKTQDVFIRKTSLSAGSYIEVAGDGRRFHDEKGRRGHFKCLHNNHWDDDTFRNRLPVHMIFDSKTLSREGLMLHTMGWSVRVKGLRWSDDNRREVEQGWIVSAPSISELAAKIDYAPEVLAGEIRKYNACCQAGHDPDFHRAVSTLQPIQGPPYYALDLKPVIVATTGGGMRNQTCQVLDFHGRCIDGLFEAGELGSWVANLYQGGLFLTECLCSGRLAGRHAASNSLAS